MFVPKSAISIVAGVETCILLIPTVLANFSVRSPAEILWPQEMHTYCVDDLDDLGQITMKIVCIIYTVDTVFAVMRCAEFKNVKLVSFSVWEPHQSKILWPREGSFVRRRSNGPPQTQ